MILIAESPSRRTEYRRYLGNAGSGYAEEALGERLNTAENVNFLPKPFSLAQLAGKVKDVIEA